MSCVTPVSALLISALVTAASVTGTPKVWGHQLSMDSASDWVEGRRPCPGQVALLDDNLAVYLHKQLQARTVVLPSNGEVVFGEGASISFVDRVASDEDHRCRGVDGGTVRFGGGAARWFDANSWRQAALPSPVPHSERVPCASGGDAVLFPDDITYRAQVQGSVTVAALAIGPHTMNNDRFRTFRNSSTGRSLFDVQGRFNISGVSRPCGTEDCTCGNDRREVLSVICGATKCPEAPCSSPIQPTGHCCPMCGAFVRVTSSGGRLQLPELRRLVGQIDGADRSQVRWYTSGTADRQLQTVLVDAAAEQQGSRRMAEALLARLTGTAQYGVTESVLRASGPRHAALVGGGRSRSAAGPVLAVLFCLLVAAGLLVWAVRTKRVSLPSAVSLRPPPPSQWRLADRAASLASQLPNVRRRLASAAAAPFHFARFRNSTCGSEVELGHRVEELESVQDSASVCTAESSESVSRAEETSQAPATATPTDQPASGGAPPKAARSFNNPMFGNAKLDDNVPPTLLAPTSALCVTPDGKSVANPFFGVPVISVAEEGQEAASPVPVAPFTDLTPPKDEEEGEGGAAANPPSGSSEAPATARNEPPPTDGGDGGDVTPGQQREARHGEREEHEQREDRELLIDVDGSD